MDFFKQKARLILIEQAAADHGYSQPGSEDKAYDGQPLQLKICYQQLKNIISRPAVSYSASTQDKPHYMKMTFAMNRSVAPTSKILQIQNMLGSIKNIKGNDSAKSQFALAKGADQSHTDMTLLRQMKGSIGSLLP